MGERRRDGLGREGGMDEGREGGMASWREISVCCTRPIFTIQPQLLLNKRAGFR